MLEGQICEVHQGHLIEILMRRLRLINLVKNNLKFYNVANYSFILVYKYWSSLKLSR